MAYWLLKTEPGTYGWDDLAREGKTVWEGVSNAAALINIRAMKKGDLAFFYHTGTERAVVGTVQIVSQAYPDPKQDNERMSVIDIKIGKKLKKPVTLDEIKRDPAFKGWDLIRIARLSVVSTPKKMWDRVLELGS
jgi:predicted RNA-binding protein with PUA-like domain